MVALVLAEGLQADEVAARARFAIALAPADFAARDLGEVMDLLLLGTEFEQRRAEHPDAEAVERRARIDALHFLLEDLRLFGRESRTAIGFRPVGDGIAFRYAGLEPLFLGVILEHPFAAAPADVAFVADGLAHFGGAVGFQPRAHFGAEGVQIAHLQGSSSDPRIRGIRQLYASVNLGRRTCRYGAVASDCPPLTGAASCLS